MAFLIMVLAFYSIFGMMFVSILYVCMQVRRLHGIQKDSGHVYSRPDSISSCRTYMCLSPSVAGPTHGRAGRSGGADPEGA